MLRVPATIHKVETMSDGGLKLLVYTQELMPEDEAEVLRLKRQLGYFVFSVAEAITEKDVPTEQLETNEKSPSARLRSVLWVLWEKKGGKPEDFEAYYKKKMEQIITRVKETITEVE
jgi:hypothetical protein